MSKIAVFASGNGSNFQSIVESSKEYDYNVDILVCNQANAFVIERANSLGIETYIFNHKDYKDRSIYEKKIINYFKVNVAIPNLLSFENTSSIYKPGL